MTDAGKGANGADDKENDNKADDGGSKLRDWFLKTAGAIIGSLGLAGVMVVIGSAVLWVRFKEAGLPAIQAISVQSRHEVLVQGAQTTIVFVLIAIAAVAALYVFDGLDINKPIDGEKADDKNKDQATDDTSKPTAQADPHAMGRRAIVFVCALPILGIAWAICWPNLTFWAVIQLAVVAIVLTIGCLWMAKDASKNFWALAAAVFVSVIVFSGVAGYLIVKEQKFIQAVAVLPGDEGPGLTGFYVTADGDTLYIATPAGPGAGRPDDKAIQKVDLGESDTYLVGPLESIPAAERTSAALLARLIASREGRGTSAAVLPSWVQEGIADTFTEDVTAHEEVPDEPLCLMRYAEASQEDKKRSFWTSCKEAEMQATIHDARERLALPGRFQKSYEVRVKVEVPSGTKLRYLEGGTAPQCGGKPDQPCGHRYPGGGLQYWFEEPKKLGELTLECTKSFPDQESVWEPCEK